MPARQDCRLEPPHPPPPAPFQPADLQRLWSSDGEPQLLSSGPNPKMEAYQKTKTSSSLLRSRRTSLLLLPAAACSGQRVSESVSHQMAAFHPSLFQSHVNKELKKTPTFVYYLIDIKALFEKSAPRSNPRSLHGTTSGKVCPPLASPSGQRR